eukprot:gene1298-32649_t
MSMDAPDAPLAKRAKRGAGNNHVRLSKEMSKTLRHNPPGGTMDKHGWVPIPVLIAHLKSKPSEDDVRAVVNTCEKKRFALDDSTDPPRVRATQGHSVKLEEPILHGVTDPKKVQVAVHLTSKDGWAAIQASGELSRMKRTHIHFATQAHLARKNSWANVILQLDLEAALADGYEFWLSANDVLLCEGPLPVKYVKQIERSELPEEWSDKQPVARSTPVDIGS